VSIFRASARSPNNDEVAMKLLPRRAMLLATGALGLGGCAIGSPPSRLGMVKDPETGLQIGSVVERTFVTDPAFHRDKRVKLRVRNVSGDAAFDLRGLEGEIKSAYRDTGYIPTDGDEFGVLVDLNVRYSGQTQRNLATEFGFLGAAAGGLAGVSTNQSNPALGAGVGAVAGATLGSILGSFVTDDTYIIVAQLTIGLVRGPFATDGRSITFDRSPAATREEEAARRERETARGLRETHSTGVSVFAGGRNVRQAEISGMVRERFVRIVRDIL
jgi:hypothetical protein